MGSADIIPGVSGGTIALITGIYERLVNALKSINISFIFYFLYGFIKRPYFKKSKQKFKEIDLVFLLVLGGGVLVAFLLLANVMSILLDDYPSYTYAFFLGLILSSAVVVYVSNKKFIHSKDFIFVLIGFMFGFFIVGLESIQADHSIVIILLSGVITFCAMILPGISGAFILLILGQYEFMLGVLRNLSNLDFSQFEFAISYGVGGIIGLVLFSRVLSFLFKRYHGATLMFIVGLMIGALRQPIGFISNESGDFVITVISIVLGIIVVGLIYYLSMIFIEKDSNV